MTTCLTMEILTLLTASTLAPALISTLATSTSSL